MIRLFFLFLLLSVTASCGSGFCSNTVVAEIVSPNRVYVASVFKRNCGATTPCISIVGLRYFNEEFDPERHDNWVFVAHDDIEVKVLWRTENEISIFYPGINDELTKRGAWNEVNVYYGEYFKN